MNHSFWTGGPSAYAEALSQQFSPKLSELRDQLAKADESDRERLESEIAKTESEYRSKLDAIGDSLF